MHLNSRQADRRPPHKVLLNFRTQCVGAVRGVKPETVSCSDAIHFNLGHVVQVTGNVSCLAALQLLLYWCDGQRRQRAEKAHVSEWHRDISHLTRTLP